MSGYRIYNSHRDWYNRDMESTVSCKHMNRSVLFQAFVLCLGTLISFIVAYSNGSVSAYLPFISETGANIPEICIFSYSLVLGSFLGIIVVCHRYIVLKYILTPDYPKLLIVNKISLICGVISMIGLAGVGAVPMSTVLWLHLLVAAMHFVAALMYIFLQTVINFYSPSSYSKWNRLRIILFVLLLIFVVMLVIIFPISQRKWHQSNSKAPAIKNPDDQGFGLVFLSASLEWLLYGAFLTYLLTFFFEFHDFQLVISVVPLGDRRDS